ncbi:hypothetical protein H2203_006820 [Taxawa tesnikishii (nom. ined.)]|nr:hypothetical protein H2203_006820 [Dothideales sp. JES 119]
MGQRPWYNNSGSAEALTWANNIQHAFTVSNVSAFLGWVGTTGSFASNDALIEVVGDDYLVSPRLWAFAQYSRFVRPGAKRVGATSTNSTLAVSAFVNADKSTAVQVINNSDTDKTVVVEGVSKGAYVQTYLSNNANNLTAVHANNAQAGYQAKVPARSMVSFVIPAKR